MARNIAADSNVVSITKSKGRGKAKTKPAAAAAAAPENDLLAVEAFKPADDEARAPAFGSNQPDVTDVRRWARTIIAKDAEIDAQKLVLKDKRGERRDLRKEAQAAGIVLGELDEAIDELKTEEVDLLAKQERLRFYRLALGLPVFDPSEKKAKAKTTAEDEASSWRKRGAQAYMLSANRELPDGVPPERIQDYLAGYDEEQEKFMRSSPLTAGAFKDAADPAKANPKAANSAAPAKHHPKVLQLDESHFAAGTALEDANLKTLMPDHLEFVEHAETVTVVFGDKRRILKEREGDGFYVDDGSEQTPVSDPEPVNELA